MRRPRGTTGTHQARPTTKFCYDPGSTMLANRLLLSTLALFFVGLGGFLWTRSDAAKRVRSARTQTMKLVKEREEAALREGYADAASTEIRGRVLSSDGGAPIDGAVVTVISLDDETHTVNVRSQGDGVFRAFATPGRYAVTAFAPGYLPRATASVVTPTRSEAVLSLVPGGLLVRGRVVDDADVPVTGALVRAYDPSDLKTIPLPLAAAVTDARGHFALSLSAGPVTFHTERDGFESHTHTAQIRASTRISATALRRSGFVEGRVSLDGESETRGVATVQWTARRWVGTSTGGLALGPAERGSVKATPAGDFSIPRLPTHARVGLHAYTSTCATESTQWLYVAPGERRDDIELSASVHPSLRGNVTASSTGAAIQHAEVTLSSNDLGRTTATTDDGAFVLPRFPRSTSVLQIRAHGYESRAIALDAGTELDRTFISLRPQTTRSMRLSSRRAGTLSVESPPGTLLTNPSSELYFINEGGRVEFSLPDAKWTTIEAIDEDGNLGAIRSSQVDQAKIPAELNMVPTQPFAGLLLDVRDRPILDAAVMLSPVRDATADAAAEVVASLRPRLSYTDDTGIFRIAKSLPGTYELRAWDARGVPISARSSTLKIPADGDNASALPINTTYALRALNGTVVDSDNNPAVGATVTVITAQQDPRATQRHPSGWMPASPRHARADAAGRFSIQVPSDVPFSLVVESQDHAQGTLSGPHDDVSGLTLQLRAYGHLEVNMDKPCAELELTSAHATMSFPLLERNADIERLIPDTYRALFRCGEATIEKTLTVQPGARHNLATSQTRD